MLFCLLKWQYSSNFRILRSENSMPSILQVMIQNWIDVNWIMLVTLTSTSPCSCFTVAWRVTLLYFLYLCKLHCTVIITQADTSFLRLFTLTSIPNVICYYCIYVFSFVVYYGIWFLCFLYCICSCSDDCCASILLLLLLFLLSQAYSSW
jgi:hypothetical protein